jgi:hypothetical protein
MGRQMLGILTVQQGQSRARALSSVSVSWFALLMLISLVLVSPRAKAQSSITTQIPAPIPPESKKKTTFIKWKLSLGGESFANDKEQAQTTGFGLVGDLRQILLPGLEIKVRAKMDLESGYAQSQFGDNTPQSGIRLDEAYVQYKPFGTVILQAGAINQEHLNAPLLVDSQPFPGALEKFTVGTHSYMAEFKAEQTIPTSTTLSTQAVSSEASPTFTTETLTLQAKPLDKVLLLKVFATHYAFTGLPSAVALQSETYGNTVVETGPNTSAFAYSFDGFLAGGEARWQITDHFAWRIDGYAIQNMQVPTSYGQAQDASTSVDIGLPRAITLTPKGEVFFIDSDAVPGFYNNSSYGHTNREGWAADLSAKFDEAKFKVGLRYVDSEVINSNLLQSRQQFMMLRFETYHDLF